MGAAFLSGPWIEYTRFCYSLMGRLQPESTQSGHLYLTCWSCKDSSHIFSSRKKNTLKNILSTKTPYEIQCFRQKKKERISASSLTWDQLNLAAGFSKGEYGRPDRWQRIKQRAVSVSFQSTSWKLAHWRDPLLGYLTFTQKWILNPLGFLFYTPCFFSVFICIQSLHCPNVLGELSHRREAEFHACRNNPYSSLLFEMPLTSLFSSLQIPLT